MTEHVDRDVDPVAVARRAIGLIDLTDLADDSSAERVDELCRRAVEHRTAAVCVWPDFVRGAGVALAGSGVRLATVVNFPSGDDRPFAVGVLTERVLTDGAEEIDVVLPHRSWLGGDLARPAATLEVVRAATSATGAVMKVILETGELSRADSIRDAARFAIDHGADFVKTSTGKTVVSATPTAVSVMLEVIARAGRPVGIKPSGGISSVDDAATYLSLADGAMGPGWVSPETFRFGASGLLSALVSALGPDHPPAAPTDPSAY